jgi:hypothetical protein
MLYCAFSVSSLAGISVPKFFPRADCTFAELREDTITTQIISNARINHTGESSQKKKA